MPKFRKKPVIIEAHQWFFNGDHPKDFCNREDSDGHSAVEGMLVKYYRQVDDEQRLCGKCGCEMGDHGWIETFEGGFIVCPGDWIITGVKGEHYPCKPDVFEATYEPVE